MTDTYSDIHTRTLTDDRDPADPASLTEQYSAHNYHPLPVTAATAEGVWVTDVAGRRYLDMLAGKLNGQMAFMTGKLRIAGDMGLALRLQSLFV